MKLFISQPMNGRPNEEIVEERKRLYDYARNKLCEIDLELLYSFFKDVPHEATPLWYLGESIKILGKADVVVFAKDWQKYRGCVIEHECAVRYGKEILYA